MNMHQRIALSDRDTSDRTTPNQPWKPPCRPTIQRKTRLLYGKVRHSLVWFQGLMREEYGDAADETLVCSERSDTLFLDLHSVLLRCLSSGHSLVGIRAGLAGFLLALTRAV